jgi:hypothetical protein
LILERNDMTARDSGWVTGGLVSAEDARLATAALIRPAGGPIRSRTGLKPAPGTPGLVRATATPSGVVEVLPFQGVIQGTRGTATGAYLVTVDGLSTVDILGAAPADPKNARRDIIVARQSDPDYGDTQARLVLQRIPDTDTASLASDVLPLAAVRVQPGVTSIGAADITDLRSYTTALGGILPVAADSGLPADGHLGSYADRASDGTLLRFDGTRWQLLGGPAPWTAVSLATGWTNYGAEYNAAAYSRTGDGWVHLRGLVKQASGAAGLVFTLPEGFRPKATWLLTLPAGPTPTSGYSMNSGRIDIRADGTVNYRYPPTPSWVSLDQLRFAVN